MSGIRDMNLTKAYASMHARGVTTATIAERVMTSRSYVSRVLAGYERRGAVWKRVRRELIPAEIELLEAVPEKEPPAYARALRRGKQGTEFCNHETHE